MDVVQRTAKDKVVGMGQGYTSKPKMSKVGLCKELEGNIFNYGLSNAADLMGTMQEKIGQYVGIKYGEDIANKLTNKSTVTIPPPVCTAPILLRHLEWERHVRRKQRNIRTAFDAKLVQLQSVSGVQDAVAIAKVENQVKDIVYQQGQEVPYNLTDSKKLKYSNKSKTHSHCVTTMEKHCGNVYALIYGQCTQILQDKMKQDRNWATVSVSYKPLELYKLIKRVVLKQTEDQYPVAVLWEQLSNIANAKQGNLTNNKLYDCFNTKVEVAESVGVSFDFENIWEYCALEAHKSSYTLLQPVKQEAVRVSARERLLSYALIKMSNSKHDKIKDDLSDDYTKGSNNYPQTRPQVLMLMNHYSKTPTAITTLESTAFAQSGKKKKKVGDKEKKPGVAKDPKDFDKEWWKDKECYRCSKKGHPASACSVKPLINNDDKSICSSKLASNAMAAIQKSMKTMGKAMTQISEITDFDNELFEEQLHAQLGVVSVGYADQIIQNPNNLPKRRGGDADQNIQTPNNLPKQYAFATRALLLRNHLLLDNQSSAHIMCNPDFVNNIQESSQPKILKSNGGSLPINEVANFEGFNRETWFLRNAMTNILSFSLVKSEYNITYDRDAFIIHRAAKATLIWCLNPTRADCMCMIRMTPEVQQVIASWRQWRAT
jgi:hypothetical protein